MILKKLDINKNEEVDFVENLYIESFPLSERRSVKNMFDYYTKNSKFEIDIATNSDEQLLGFLTYWNLGTFIFAEHFAVSPEFRNGGNGRKIMDLFLSKSNIPIVLEVELPTTILSERRIGFYQRIGFKLWEDILYQQPPYHDNSNAIPMKLMSYGRVDIAKNLTEIRSAIYSEVYNY